MIRCGVKKRLWEHARIPLKVFIFTSFYEVNAERNEGGISEHSTTGRADVYGAEFLACHDFSPAALCIFLGMLILPPRTSGNGLQEWVHSLPASPVIHGVLHRFILTWSVLAFA
ncbi:hypothetical protein J6590_042352 [Homalodisca vitripennis]|nr:hypothetical protein J6590_042352 [Homalodisca vitripennis]